MFSKLLGKIQLGFVGLFLFVTIITWIMDGIPYGIQAWISSASGITLIIIFIFIAIIGILELIFGLVEKKVVGIICGAISFLCFIPFLSILLIIFLLVLLFKT